MASGITGLISMNAGLGSLGTKALPRVLSIRPTDTTPAVYAVKRLAHMTSSTVD